MNKQPNTLVFDIGGVLIDWNPRYLYRKLFSNGEEMEMFLRDICSPEWNAKQESGRSSAKGSKELIKVHPEQTELIEAYDKRSEEMITGAIEPTVKLLECLYNNGHELYGLSNWSAEKFSITRKRFKFLYYLKDIVVSGEVGFLKPNPDIYNYFLRRINRSAEDCLFIDDSLKNVKAAQELGFHTVHFKDAEDLEQHLASYGFDF